MNDIRIHRAPLDEIDTAFAIIEEYYEAAHVVARDSRGEFAAKYFQPGSGIWLATLENHLAGCIALRKLTNDEPCGEVKRLYVRPEYRGRHLAKALHDALEAYAANYGHASLYLDTTNEMVAAQRFYEAQGYQRCHRYNDNPQATIFMRKKLLKHS